LFLVEIHELFVAGRHHAVDRPGQARVLGVELGQQGRHLLLPRQRHALRQRARQHHVTGIDAGPAVVQLVGQRRAGRRVRGLTLRLRCAEQRSRVLGLARAGLASLAEFPCHVCHPLPARGRVLVDRPRLRVNRARRRVIGQAIAVTPVGVKSR
jgi:hypothetical protein